MLKIKVNYPEDMTEIENKIAEFQAKLTMKYCTIKQVKVIIKYLEKEGF